MYSYKSNGSRAASARGFMALFAMLAMGLGLGARPAEAAPFAYVTNGGDISVIDTATNMVVATIPVGAGPVAVAPDGEHVYVGSGGDTVLVIDTATNMVVAPIPVGQGVAGLAVAPDGKHVYVAGPTGNLALGQVSVIDTGSNTVVATVAGVGQNPVEIAISPDGQHAYVTSWPPEEDGAGVAVIATASNTVVAWIPVGFYYQAVNGIAITPDGTRAYVSNITANDVGGRPILVQEVSVIDTGKNTVVASLQGSGGEAVFVPGGVAVTPDGTRAYVADFPSFGMVAVIDTASNTVVATVTAGGTGENERGEIAITPDGKSGYVTGGANVAVIDTARNRVVDTIPVVGGAFGVGIIPDVPFLAFGATGDIFFGAAPNDDSFNLHSQFTLSSSAPAINPLTDPVTFQVGTFSTTIPPGSFTKQPDGSFFFEEVSIGPPGSFVKQLDGSFISLKARITPTATLQYMFHAKATGASLIGTKNPVTVRLSIGADEGITSVTIPIH